MRKSEKKLNKTEPGKAKADPIHKKSNHTGKTPRQVMRKHILDKNDVITEEDFENLDISVDISDESSLEQLEIPADHDRPKDEEKEHSIVTPWDVIKE
jgi:hypothetical protein